MTRHFTSTATTTMPASSPYRPPSRQVALRRGSRRLEASLSGDEPAGEQQSAYQEAAAELAKASWIWPAPPSMPLPTASPPASCPSPASTIWWARTAMMLVGESIPPGWRANLPRRELTHVQPGQKVDISGIPTLMRTGPGWREPGARPQAPSAFGDPGPETPPRHQGRRPAGGQCGSLIWERISASPLRAGLSATAEIDTGHQRTPARPVRVEVDMTSAATGQADQASRRTFITLSVMVATIMQALDTTIANVALPHAGSDGGLTRSDPWVSPPHIVAAAISCR